MNDKIPQYLVEFLTNVKILAFVMLSAFAFILIYPPFQEALWFKGEGLSSAVKFFFGSIVIVGGIAILGLSRFFLWLVNRKKLITILQYCFWLIGEIIIIAVVYTIIDYTVLRDTQRDFMDILEHAVVITPLMLLIPYVVAYLYLALDDRNKKLQQLLDAQRKEEMRFDNSAVVAPQKEVEEVAVTVNPENSIINFFDEKGTLKLSIRRDYVYFIESADNYVNIHYEKNGKIVHTLVRTTLRGLEESLKPQGFVRCHRSYLVNVKKIKLVRKERDGFFIELDHDGGGDIPISKAHSGDVMQFFA